MLEKIVVKTKKNREIVDVTDEINKVLKKSAMKNGFCRLFLPHTTAALTAANLDPERDLDILEGIEMVTPKKELSHLRHLLHVPTNIVASFLGSSLTVPFEKDVLVLGKWQRVVLIELNGPREREILVGVA